LFIIRHKIPPFFVLDLLVSIGGILSFIHAFINVFIQIPKNIPLSASWAGIKGWVKNQNNLFISTYKQL